MSSADESAPDDPTHQRPVIRNLILLVLFVAMVVIGVFTVLLPALDEGSGEDPDGAAETTAEQQSAEQQSAEQQSAEQQSADQ